VGPHPTTSDVVTPGHWYNLWGDFFKTHKAPSLEDIFQFGNQLMEEFGLSGLQIGPY